MQQALPSLNSLSVGNIPLLKGFDRRRILRMLVPVFPSLVSLNDVPFDARARTDAEKDFLMAALQPVPQPLRNPSNSIDSLR